VKMFQGLPVFNDIRTIAPTPIVSQLQREICEIHDIAFLLH